MTLTIRPMAMVRGRSTMADRESPRKSLETSGSSLPPRRPRSDPPAAAPHPAVRRPRGRAAQAEAVEAALELGDDEGQCPRRTGRRRDDVEPGRARPTGVLVGHVQDALVVV